ncbi:hypothetical protein, partial [Ureaplasma zalophigenitalium]
KSQLQKAQEAKNNIDNQKPEQLKKVIQELANALTDANNQLNEHTKNISSEKQQINDGIKQAELIKQQLANNSDSTELKTKIDAAINATKTILDNPKSSVDELKNANQTLKMANITNSAAKKALEQTKETALDELKKEITAADTALDDLNNKQNPTVLRKVLRNALDVLANSGVIPVSDVKQKTKELKSAIENFKSESSNSTNNDDQTLLDELEDLIKRGHALSDTLKQVGLNDDELKLRLQEAKNNIVNQKPEQLKKVIQDLRDVISDTSNRINEFFSSDKNISSEKQQINDGIRQAELIKQQLANNSDFTELRTKIDQDIATAQTTLNNSNSTLDDLKKANQILEAANKANIAKKTNLENSKQAAINALQTQITFADESINKPSNKNKDITSLTQSIIEALKTILNKDDFGLQAVNAMTDKLQAAIQTFEAQEVVDPTAKYKELLGEKINKLISDADAVAAANTANRITDDELVQQIAAAKKMKDNLEHQTADEIEAQINALLNSLNDANKNLNKILDKKELLASELQKTEALLKSLKPNSDYDQIKATIQASLTTAKTIFDQANPTPEKLQIALDNLKTANTANAETKKTLDQEHLDKAQKHQQIYNAAIDILTDPQILDTPERQVLLGLKTSELDTYLKPNQVNKEVLQTRAQTISDAIKKTKIASAKQLGNNLISELGSDSKYNDIKEKLTDAINELNTLANDADEPTVSAAIEKFNAAVKQAEDSKKELDQQTDNSALINNFNKLKETSKNYAQNDIADDKYSDIKDILNAAITKNDAVVNPTNGSSPTSMEIQNAEKDLERVLEQTKLKKQIRDLQSRNNEVSPPREYLEFNKTKHEILEDYKKFLDEAKTVFLEKTAQLSNKYQTEVIPGDTENIPYPKSYKEMNDPTNNEETNNKKYLKYINDELAWVEEQKTTNTTTNKELVQKINLLFKERYRTSLQMNLEDKIENTRQHLRMFASSLHKDRYKKILEQLKAHLRQIPDEETKKPLIFKANSTLVELEAINLNLLEILNAVPGEIAKADLTIQIKDDLKDLIPSISAFYDQSKDGTIDVTQNPWVSFLQTNKISELEQKANKLKEEVQTIPSTNFIAIREKVDQFDKIKAPYIKAYYDAMDYQVQKHIQDIKTNKIGDINIDDLSTFFDAIPKTEEANKKLAPLIQTIKQNVDTMKKGFKDIELIPEAVGPNLLHAQSQSRLNFEALLNSKDVSFSVPSDKIHNTIKEVQKELEKYFNGIYNTFHKNDEEIGEHNANASLTKFVAAIQKDRTVDTTHPDLQKIFSEISEKTTMDIPLNQPLKNQLSIIASVVEQDKIFKDHFNNYAREYFIKQMNNDQIKTELQKTFVKNNISYLLGTYDSGAENGETSWAYNTEEETQFSNFLYQGTEGEYGQYGQGFAKTSINYLNDLSMILNNVKKIQEQSTADATSAKYAYALFIYLQNKADASQSYDKIFLVQKRRLPFSVNDRENVPDYYISNLLGNTNTSSYINNYGFFEMLNYMLLGLSLKYEATYQTKHPKEQLDTSYLDQSNNLKAQDSLTPIQLTHKVLDIFGVDVWRYWAGFKDFDSEKLYFKQPLEWYNNNDIVYEVNVGKISTKQDKEFPTQGVQIYNYKTQSNQTIMPGTKVNSSVWMENSIKEILNAYEKLYLAYMDLLSNDPNGRYALVNKKILGFSSTKVSDHKEIDLSKLSAYDQDPKIESNNGDEFIYLK